MTRHWKKASVGTSLALAALALAGYSYTRAQAAPTYSLANGVEVTPVDVQTDELSELTAAMLDVKVWKFHVLLPQPNKLYDVEINSYNHGAFVDHVGGCGIHTEKANQQSEMTITLAPIGSDFQKSDLVKCRISSDTSIVSDTFKNPFKGCEGFTSEKTAAVSNNLAYLIGGSKDARIYFDPASDDISLALSIKLWAIK